MRALLIIPLFLYAHTALASVVITEIAWMGDSTSADNEWIELHNTTSNSVSLDGWRLEVSKWDTQELALSIDLNGVIAPSAYAVLERTDESSAEGTALLIYKGALANTGATLSLYNTSDALVDRVAGGEGWEHIHGDNETKETAQKSAQGWQSAVATPGRATTGTPAQDQSDEDEDEQDEDTNESSDAAIRSARDDNEPVTIELTLPDTELVVSTAMPVRAFVNQPLSFVAGATGIGRTHLNSLTYEWNFGDLSTESGKEVEHMYAYPGEYVVSLSASFGRHSDTIRSTITVLPVSFSLSWNEDSLLHIHNNARYEVDVSGYTLSGVKSLVFPRGTILLPNATLTVHAKRMEVSPYAPVTLLDQEGIVVAESNKTSDVANTPFLTAHTPPPAPKLVSLDTEPKDDVVTSGSFLFADEVMSEEQGKEDVDLFAKPVLDRTPSAQEIPAQGQKWPYMALAGLLAFGCVGILATRIR